MLSDILYAQDLSDSAQTKRELSRQIFLGLDDRETAAALARKISGDVR